MRKKSYLYTSFIRGWYSLKSIMTKDEQRIAYMKIWADNLTNNCTSCDHISH